MMIFINFFLIVLVWSTTPLGVKIGAIETDPYTSLFFRMSLAAILGHITLKVMRLKLPCSRTALIYFLISNIGFSGGIVLVYLSATYISSGLMSLIFGSAPIVSRLLGQKLLGEVALTARQWIGFLMAFVGLITVLYDRLFSDASSAWGILLCFSAIVLFCFSTVLLKRNEFEGHFMVKCVGTVTLSLVPLSLIWLFLGEPIQVDTVVWWNHGWLAIVYLAIIGTLVGHAAYFYVLQHLSPTTMGIANLLSPIAALYLSQVYEGTLFGTAAYWGVFMTLLGLMIFLVKRPESAYLSKWERKASVKTLG